MISSVYFQKLLTVVTKISGVKELECQNFKKKGHHQRFEQKFVELEYKFQQIRNPLKSSKSLLDDFSVEFEENEQVQNRKGQKL